MNFHKWYQEELTLWERCRMFFSKTRLIMDPQRSGSVVVYKWTGKCNYVLDVITPSFDEGLSIYELINQRKL